MSANTSAVHHRSGAKLTEAQVLEIRALDAANVPLKDIWMRFDVGMQTLSHIVRGESWTHLLPPDGA